MPEYRADTNKVLAGLGREYSDEVAGAIRHSHTMEILWSAHHSIPGMIKRRLDGVKVATLPVIALGVGIGVDYALYILSVMLAAIQTQQADLGAGEEGQGDVLVRVCRFVGHVCLSSLSPAP